MRKAAKYIFFCILCLSFFILVGATNAESSSVVTVLNNAGVPVSNVKVDAYGSSGTYLATVYTNTSGAALFAISDGIQARFKIINYNCFTYDSGLVTTPANLTVNLPVPSIITVLSGSSGVNGAFVYAYSSTGQSLGMVRTDTQGKAPCYLNAGLSFRFTVKYNGFTSFESALVAAPYSADVQLPAPTPVTVFDQGLGVQNATVYAYDNVGISYGNGITNSSGLVNCYVKEGIQIKFVIQYGGFASGESAFVQTPSSVTFDLPQPSSVTILNGITPLAGVRVYAYDDTSKQLGYNNTNAQGIVTCYLAEGKLVKFKFQYADVSYESGLLLTPVDHNVNLAPPSTVTILDSGAGVEGIEVSAYDGVADFLTSSVTDTGGVALLHINSGTQFTYSFSYKGYSHTSGLITAPADNTVNLPAPSVITVIEDGAGAEGVGVYVFDIDHDLITEEYTDAGGDAYFYITGGRQVTFEILHRGFEYTSGLVAAPFTETIGLYPTSTIRVTDGGTPLNGVFVYAYGDYGQGLASDYTDSNGSATFYFKAGKKVVFEAQYGSSRYFSEWLTAPADGSIDINSQIKPASVCQVRAKERGITVNGVPYKIKGVAYQPTPVGEVPWASNWANDTGIFNRDFPILVNMNVNTLRTWNRVTDTLMDTAASYGIKVIAGYWIDPAIDYADPVQRANIKADFKSYVSQFKNKPALLFWAIGNAQNRDVAPAKLPYWYSLVNEMAYEAFLEERLFYHPVAVVNDSLGFLGDPAVGSDDASMKYLDIWGAEILAGLGLSGYFDAYALLSNKPLWIATYGVDAYDNNTGMEDQATQASWLSQNAAAIMSSALTIGGTLNEYSDELWLAGNEWSQDTGGWPSAAGALPDNYANVEWWGIASVTDNGTGPDIITLRQAADSLRVVFDAGEPPVLDPVGDQSISEYDTLAFTVTSTDPDEDAVSYALETVSGYEFPAGASIDAVTGEFIWETDYDDGGEYRVRIKAIDAKYLYDYEDITIEVANIPVTRVGTGQEYSSIKSALADPGHKAIVYVYSDTYDTGTLEVDDYVILKGEKKAPPLILGNLVFLDTEAAVQNFTIGYGEGQNVAYSSAGGNYTEFNILADAAITAVNSEITLMDCVILPDLDAINASGGYDPPLTHYGKGIQIWDLYAHADVNPVIENNIILRSDSAIYLFSQAAGGSILGNISNNTLDLNNYGVVSRMNKESPVIEKNIITNSRDAVHFAYDSLLSERLLGITGNCFGAAGTGNIHNGWCDALSEDTIVTPDPKGNISEDPLYSDPQNLDYTPQNPDCADKGARL